MNHRADEGKPRLVLLTRTELRVLAAVEDLREEASGRRGPTLAQLAARLGWSSRGTVSCYLARLRRLGVIEGSGRDLRSR